MLLPEIRAMAAEGKTQREIAEYYGFKNKYVVKQLLTRERRKEQKLKAGIVPRPKDRPGKILRPKILQQSRRIRSNVCRWKTSCCGIFCSPQEGRAKIKYFLQS